MKIKQNRHHATLDFQFKIPPATTFLFSFNPRFGIVDQMLLTLLGHGPIHCGIMPLDLCVKLNKIWMLNISYHYQHLSFCGKYCVIINIIK